MRYQIDSVEEITPEYIAATIKEFNRSDERKKLVANQQYAIGQNPFILNRTVPEDSGPDNRTPVSYAKRIVNLVVGYMYKPGLVQYTFEDEGFQTAMTDVFDVNREPLKTEQMGKQVSTQGVGYEFHYVKGQMDSEAQVRATPRFVRLPVTEVVPVYDYAIEPELLAFMRYFERGEDVNIFVYDSNAWKEYRQPKDGGAIQQVNDGRHYYGQVPLVVFQNNDEYLGDFDAAQPLIDAYDVLMSDSLNEFDRFAWAYLILKGMSLTQEDAANVKRLRVFEGLSEEAQVSFLTKEIDTEFIKFMSDWVRNEIHRQSGIPNLEDYDASGASGKTMSKFIYLMELFTDPKESYFKEGLFKRIELINAILSKVGGAGDVDDVDIIMNRNTPDNSLEQAEIFNKFSGFISQKTLMENFADFVDDVDEEIAQLAAESPVFDAEAFSEAAEEVTGD